MVDSINIHHIVPHTTPLHPEQHKKSIKNNHDNPSQQNPPQPSTTTATTATRSS
jgi:hypothetical protein